MGLTEEKRAKLTNILTRLHGVSTDVGTSLKHARALAATASLIWNKDEGVLDTRVLAAHEARSGQPTGTFGAHRGARSKTIVPLQVVGGSVASSVEVFQESCKIPRSS